MKNKILSLIIACLVFANCEVPLDYQLKIDNRLEGKDEVYIAGPNGSGVDYTEDFFTGSVDLTVVSQAKPLKVEVVNGSTSTLVDTIETSTENGGNYETTFSSSVIDLGIGIGDKTTLVFKVVFGNAGEDGFDYNAELSTSFTIKDQSPNLALNKPVTSSSVADPGWGGGLDNQVAVDGIRPQGWPDITHTNDPVGVDSWIEIDLESVVTVRQINIWGRGDCCQERVSDYHVFISETPFAGNSVAEIQAQDGVTDIHETNAPTDPTKLDGINKLGRYVRIQLSSTNDQYLSIAEVEVF